jgi:hypothetical protein
VKLTEHLVESETTYLSQTSPGSHITLEARNIYCKDDDVPNGDELTGYERSCPVQMTADNTASSSVLSCFVLKVKSSNSKNKNVFQHEFNAVNEEAFPCEDP